MGDRSGVIAHTDGNESTRAILEDVLRDVTNIMRAEVRLARAEIKDDLRTAGRAAGMFGAALSLVLAVWLAALITAVILACIGGALYATGRNRMRQAPPPLEETRQRVRSDYQWAKQQIK
jgi:hypothetical protein